MVSKKDQWLLLCLLALSCVCDFSSSPSSFSSSYSSSSSSSYDYYSSMFKFVMLNIK